MVSASGHWRKQTHLGALGQRCVAAGHDLVDGHAHRAAFVNNILTVVENFGFDGVDLDWEPLTARTRPP